MLKNALSGIRDRIYYAGWFSGGRWTGQAKELRYGTKSSTTGGRTTTDGTE